MGKSYIMKAIIKTITLGAFILGTTATINVQAHPLEIKEMHDGSHHHALDSKSTEKVRETVQAMSKDLGLDEKQTMKIQEIKLDEANQIESARMDENKSQDQVNNAIIMIQNDTRSKVEKVLSKDQVVLFQAKKSNYEYNPGFIENVKDKYMEKKEDIQERREEKKK